MILKPLFIAVVIGCRGSVLDSLMSAQHGFFMRISKHVDDDGNEWVPAFVNDSKY